MRYVTAALVIGTLLLVVSTAAASAVPGLTPFDLERAEVTDATEITDSAELALRAGGQFETSGADAIAVASKFVDVSPGVRVWRGSASDVFFGPEQRAVYVVVVAGGRPPFDGPADEPQAPFRARITGILIDAATGEFIRGFMFN